MKRTRYSWLDLDKSEKWTDPPRKMIRGTQCEIDANASTAKVLKEFPLLGRRMVHLLEQMEGWKPRSFRELFIPGYAARMDWWVAMFAIFFGIISVLGLGLSGYQAFVGQRQLSIALQALPAGPTGP